MLYLPTNLLLRISVLYVNFISVQVGWREENFSLVADILFIDMWHKKGEELLLRFPTVQSFTMGHPFLPYPHYLKKLDLLSVEPLSCTNLPPANEADLWTFPLLSAF